jgi:spore maturation protein CgeB
MKFLYIGTESGTGGHRVRALRRMGHAVRPIDPRRLLPAMNFIDVLEWKVHPRILSGLVRVRILNAIEHEQYDFAFIDGGSLVGPGLIRALQKRGCKVVNFNHDDPFGRRDRMRYALYRAAIPFYDLVAVVRRENVAEAKAMGARRVMRTFMVADESFHVPRPESREDRRIWQSEVAFVGTWMPGRGSFLARLLDLGVPLSIFGNGWERSGRWQKLRTVIKTQGLADERYCLAIQYAKICLGLLSSGNRDLYTTRSMEIPAIGSLLCAQRTDEHEQLYVEGSEAVFWSDADECARICHELLRDEARRNRIAQAGHRRCLENGHFSQNLLQQIIDASA